MPSIPLPFVVSLVLCLVLLRMARQDRGKPGLFHLFVGTSAAQAAVSGAHWGFGWDWARSIQPILAAVLPALAFAAFDRLRRGRTSTTSQLSLHLAPPGVVLCLVALWREPIDLVLFAIYLGYGLALFRLARPGPSGLFAARFGDEATAYQALVGVAGLLVVTAFVDAAVSYDLVVGAGRQVHTMLTVASVLWLAVAGYAATIADASRPSATLAAPDDFTEPSAASRPSEDIPSPSSPSLMKQTTATDAAVAQRIKALMVDRHLYRDPDLTLERLARRVGLPARQISGCLNRVYGRNVSQIVNDYRIEDAKRQLVSTRDPVTTVMLASGFGTKSNFNREFLRVTGMTPSAFRRAAETPAAPLTRGTGHKA